MGPIQHVAFLVGSCTLCGCSTAEWRPLPEDSGWTSKDVDCPLISHDPVSSAQTAGRAVPIQAVVSDDLDGDCEIEPDESGVFEVQVFFRTEVATFWTSVPLVRMDGGDAYGGAIPGSAVTSGG
ncbi:MAG: hypothetical protein JXB39_06205, partial [Deltaproteobacteria bacterium]|nr:hypothetical protein [Deltaproteobacteria bacterium]